MIKRLLYLNGLAVLGVGLHHASGYGFRAMFFWTDRYLPVSVPYFELSGSVPFYFTVLIQQLDAYALPAFMFVSGVFVAFMSGSGDQPIEWKTVSSRITKLLIPFAIWTALFFVLLQRRIPSSFDEVVSRYYYIVLLIQFYAISPLLVLVARRNWKITLSVLALVELVTSSLNYFQVLELQIPGLEMLIQVTPKWLIPNLLFWFVFGIVAGMHRDALQAYLEKHRTSLALLFVSLIPLMMLEYLLVQSQVAEPWLGPYFGGILRNIYAGVFILLFLAIDSNLIPLVGWLDMLGSRSLGIYLAHGPVMYVAAVAMYRGAPFLLGNQFLYQGILLILGLGIPILLMSALKRSPTRKYYRYVFG